MSLYKLFSYLINKNRGKVLIAILLSVITIMSSVMLFSLSSYIISFCALHPSVADIAVAVVGVRFFGISRGGFRYLERLISHNTTFSLLSNLRVYIYERIEGLNIFKYMQMDKEDAFTRIIDDVEMLQEFYLRTFTPFIVSVLVGVGGVIFLMFFNINIALAFLGIYFVTILLVPIIIWYSSRGLYSKMVQGKADFKVQLLDILENLGELIGNSALEKWMRGLEGVIEDNKAIDKKIVLWRSITNNLITLLTGIGMVISLGFGVFLVRNNEMNGVYLAVVALATSSLFEGTAAIPAMLQKIEQSKAAADRIFSIASNDDNRRLEKSSEAITSQDVTNQVSLNEVSFSYSSKDEALLQNINLHCEIGKRVAIVGSSGSGKTTLSYILMNWLRPDKGSVEINDIQANNLSEEVMTEYFSVLNQRVYFFNTSIRNNLIIGNSSVTEEEINRALEIANIKDFIDRLPSGLDSELGEEGNKFSVGQRQRLAIARTLLKKAPFLILDEPTAGLDMETEKNVLDSLYENTSDRGLIIITHRLVAMEKMDEIYVLDKGRIVEKGKHHDLMELNGIYSRMWKAQREYLVN